MSDAADKATIDLVVSAFRCTVCGIPLSYTGSIDDAGVSPFLDVVGDLKWYCAVCCPHLKERVVRAISITHEIAVHE
jgi:hypothetical protein